MTRFLFAVALTASLAADAVAQLPAVAVPNPATGSQLLGIGPMPALPSLNPPPLPGPVPTPGPPVITPGIGYYKSGGVFVGADGNFPHDTGAYLLAGDQGLARSAGTFTMVPGGGASAPAAVYAPVAVPCATRHGHVFRR